MRAEVGVETDLLARIVEVIDDTSARGIAAAISRMVSAGDLPAELRMPTVRDIAASLGVSPTTVSSAWRSLTQAGVLVARGRNGTYVNSLRPADGVGRFFRTYESPGPVELDLSTGIPDPSLLPDLGKALEQAHKVSTTSYIDPPVLAELEDMLGADWPYKAGALTVVNGALDALALLTAQLVRMGDPVMVENPGFPPLLDLLELAGAEVVGIPVDESGPQVDAVKAALKAGPVALFLQPRAHNPTGVVLSRQRAGRLAGALRGRPVLVIEDDHAGEISSADLVSLGTYLPEQTVHIRSFSKSHGPDLRLAAVGGSAEIVEALNHRRILGSGWTSRLLQAVLVHLLSDPSSRRAVDRARQVYADRRTRMVDLLDRRGVTTTGSDGINLWVEVPDEQRALVQLAASGIGVAPGSPFLVGRLPADHLRLTVGLVGDQDALRVADALALASEMPRTRYERRRSSAYSVR